MFLYAVKFLKMKKIFVLLFFSPALCLAQLKQISLEDAVLQQNRAFKADKLTGFQWIPKTNSYSYLTDNFSKLVSASVLDKTEKEITTPKMLTC